MNRKDKGGDSKNSGRTERSPRHFKVPRREQGGFEPSSRRLQETSWGTVAPWYNELLKDEKSYQRELILPNLSRLLAPSLGDVILDLACGQGFFAKEIARSGARVLGIDISPELVAMAKKEAPASCHFLVSSAENLRDLKDAEFAKAYSVLAIQNVTEYQNALLEVARILRIGGMFVIVLNHPTFRIPQHSSWGFDEKGYLQYRRIDRYMSEVSAEIDMEPGKSGVGAKTISFHRPLQAYFKALQKAGFVVERLEEWISPRKSQSGPRQIAEDRARKEFPIFLALVARKV